MTAPSFIEPAESFFTWSPSIEVELRNAISIGWVAGVGSAAVLAAMWLLLRTNRNQVIGFSFLVFGSASLTWGTWQFFGPSPLPKLANRDSSFDHAAFQDCTIQETLRLGSGEFVAIVGTPKRLLTRAIPAGSHLVIDWAWNRHPNPEVPRDGAELWRSGFLTQPIRCGDYRWPRRSLVAIESDPADRSARRLAACLLDLGSADAVLITRTIADSFSELVGFDPSLTRNDQLIVVRTGASGDKPAMAGIESQFEGAIADISSKNLDRLWNSLNFQGVIPVEDAWSEVAQSIARQDERPVFLCGAPRERIDHRTGITFVKVWAGTFTMGSESEEALPDEQPAHPVTISPFWISRHEVTNRQYRKHRPDHIGSDSLPAITVKWREAKDYCEAYGYNLPSEAQWEYAARGGSDHRWSFGDDEDRLGDHAWFNGNADERLRPVGLKAPNPLGLFDVHGNAWEWVADAAADLSLGYPLDSIGSFLVDPLETVEESKTRILRGGSYWFRANYVRSAFRFQRRADIRFDFVGFRCVINGDSLTELPVGLPKPELSDLAKNRSEPSECDRRRRSRDDGAPKIGDLAPPFSILSLDGETVIDSEEILGEKPVVLIFGSYT